MKKLLHERLRRIDNQEYTSVVLENGHAITFWDNEAQYLADEIERNYIPRLRFENDAPLQWGEMVDGYDKPIDGIKLFSDGSGSIGNHSDSDLYWIPFSNVKKASLKRPQPKVLDADGVEIKVGDTVFDKDGEEYGVFDIEDGEYPVKLTQNGRLIGWNSGKFLTHKKPVLDADGVPIKVGDTVWHLQDKCKVLKLDDSSLPVLLEFECDPPAWCVSGNISHKEPDSYMKLRDEMSCAYSYSVREWADRLTALMKRDA